MDQDRLAALGERYADASGDVVFTERFRPVIELQYSESGNRSLAGHDIVGGDVVEVAPQHDATTNTAHVGAQMMFEVLSMMAYALSQSS